MYWSTNHFRDVQGWRIQTFNRHDRRVQTAGYKFNTFCQKCKNGGILWPYLESPWKNAFKFGTNMPGIGSVNCEIDVNISDMSDI